MRKTNVTEAGANQLKEKLPQLMSIRLDSQMIGGIARRAAVNQQPYSVTNYSGKKNVHMRVALTDEILEKLKKEKDIDTVFMTRSLAADGDLKMIAQLPIKGLVVKSVAVTDAGLEALRKNESIHSLTVTSSQVSDAATESLVEIPSLKKLWMYDAKLTDSGTQKLVAGLARKNQVTWLKLNNCPKLTNDSLRNVAELTSLEKLDFSGNPAASSVVLRHFRDMPHLTEIRLGATAIEPEDVEHLATLKIEDLDFSESKLGTGVLAALVDACPQLKQLSLSKTNVADTDMEAIGKLKQLESLSLYDTKVGDEGLAKLDDLKNLQHIYVKGSPVSREGELRFKEKHPDAELHQR